MENADMIKSHEDRLQRLEASVESLSSRMGKVEDKASSAWKMINDVKDDVGNLYDKVEELDTSVKELVNRYAVMETDMKIVKSEQTSINKTLKWLTGGIIGLGLVVGAFLFYIWRHDSALAKEILSFGAMVATTIA